MGNELRLFVPILKVDAVQRMVYGTAADESTDHTKEVFDYESSKPLFQAWSANFEKLTDGKSLGNVRAMHGKVAAGKVTELGLDDARKAVDVATKIVDDDEWRKVEEGVYTGFSIGGSYVKKWKDGELTRYTANPSEISLVDLPCNPGATFSFIKSEGVEELRKFHVAAAPAEPTASEVAERATSLAKAAGKDTKWPDFITAARDELLKEKAPGAREGGAGGPAPEGDQATNVPKGGVKTPPHEGKQGHMGDKGSDENKIGDGGHTTTGKEKKPGDAKNNDEKDPPQVADSVKEHGADSTVSHKAADPLDLGAQVWTHPSLPGQQFAKKADMRQALLDHDAAKAAAKQAAPVMDVLKGLTDVLDRREGKKVEFSIAEMVEKGFDAKVQVAIGATDLDWVIFKTWLGENDENLKVALKNTGVPAITADEDGDVTVPQAAAAAIRKVMGKALQEDKAAIMLGKRDFSEAERKEAASSGAAMKDGSFPIKNSEDVKNAVSLHGQAKNKAAAKRHIIRRAKAVGGEDHLPDDWKAKKVAGDGGLLKAVSFYGVSGLLQLLAALEQAEEAAEVDEYWGGAINVSKELKDRFGQAVVEVGDIAAELLDAVIAAMREEESREAMERAAPILDLMKVGARHSGSDKGLIKKAHDTMVELDKDCCPSGDGAGAADKALVADLTKQITAKDGAFAKQLEEIVGKLTHVVEAVKRIEDTPMPMASLTMRSVTKGHQLMEDAGTQTPADPEATLAKAADAAIRLAHRRPFQVG